MAICNGDFVSPETIDGICFDMDGVLADLFGVDEWEPRLRMSSPAPYAEAVPLLDTAYLEQLLETLRDYHGIDVSVISWSSRDADWYYDKQVEKVKTYWLERHLPVVEDIHVVPYGTDKASLVYGRYNNPILFDDMASNCEEWYWQNGIVVDGDPQEIVIPTLESLLDYRDGLLGYGSN